LLGTFVEIAVFDAKGEVEAAIDAAFAAVARVHELMSFHDADSDVSRLNRSASTTIVTVDPSTFEVLQAAIELNERSHGAFDVAVAPALQELGLLPRHDDRPPSRLPIASCAAIQLLAGCAVRFLAPGLCVDLGGIAKGFAVDRAVEVLKQSGVAAGLVNAGGDIAVFGPLPQTISLRHPLDPRILACDVAVKNGAIASSAGGSDPSSSSNVAASQIIDPRTRQAPPLAGATVRAPSCMLADALTKVVMIEGDAAEALLTSLRAAALIVSADGQISASPNWYDPRAH